MSDSSVILARLRQRLERLEPCRAPASTALVTLGPAVIDRALGGGLARGRLHEIFADAEDGASGAGFAALVALRAGGETGRPLLWLRTGVAERRAGALHATGLGALGIDPARLLMLCAPDEAALLHAAAEAARCGGLGALLVECHGAMRGLDLTASRRLMLAAEGSGVTVLLLRIAAQPAPGAVDTRWRVAAAPSAMLEAYAPGPPAFDVDLLRRRAGPPAGPWRVEWDRDAGYFRDAGEDARREAAGAPALSRPVLPLAAGRAPARRLRRAG